MSGFDLDLYLDDRGEPRPGAPLGMLLTAQAVRDPARPALTIDDVTVSRAELDAAVNRRARYFASLGIGLDDIVVVALPNGREFYETALASWKLGATPLHVSYRLTEKEFAETLELARPSLIVGGPPVIEGDVQRLSAEQPIDESFSAAPLPPLIARSWKISTTGGSTGRPKLVIDSLPASWGNEKMVVGRTTGMTVVNPAPLYHGAPFGSMVPALLQGCHVVDMDRFDPERWLELVERHHAEWIYLVPTMMTRIARLPEDVRARYSLASIRALLHMAAPCPEWVKRFWIDALGPDAVWEVYGGAERFGSTLISGTEWLAHPGSVGRPGAGMAARILDREGHPMPAGEVGEIYFRRENGPVSVVRDDGGAPREKQEWASFGDLGYLDSDGYLYIADRRTDMIVSGGANLYPAEIEAALESCPGVLGAVVVGLPDDELGQRPHAVVQITPNASGVANEADIFEQLRGRLTITKHPRTISLTTRVLRDDAGKVRRSSLRAEVIAGLI